LDDGLLVSNGLGDGLGNINVHGNLDRAFDYNFNGLGDTDRDLDNSFERLRNADGDIDRDLTLLTDRNRDADRDLDGADNFDGNGNIDGDLAGDINENLNGLRDLDRDVVRSGDTDRDLVRLGDADFNTSRGGVDLTDDFNWDRHSNSNFIRSIDFLSDGFGDLAGDVALDFNRHRHTHVDVVRAGDANRHLDGDVDRDSNSVGLGNLDGDRLGDRDVTVLRDSTLNGDINLLNLLNGSQDFVRLVNKNLNRDVVGNSDFHISKLNLRDRDINLSVH
jgi:hypothetical protein